MKGQESVPLAKGPDYTAHAWASVGLMAFGLVVFTIGAYYKTFVNDPGNDEALRANVEVQKEIRDALRNVHDDLTPLVISPTIAAPRNKALSRKTTYFIPQSSIACDFDKKDGHLLADTCK